MSRVSPIIFNPDTAPYAPLFNRLIEAAAPSFGINVTLAPVRSDAAIEEAITTLARERGGGTNQSAGQFYRGTPRCDHRRGGPPRLTTNGSGRIFRQGRRP